MTSLIGRNLGQYEVRDVIGHGGMASVYLGYRADVDRQVAIKVLPPHPGLNDDAKHRFQLEARTIANLQHPHILPLYDYGATDDGVLYLVMPFVRGGSLDRIVRDGKLSNERVARMVRELSGALDYAHRQGVIHRDIKPGNILLDGEGNALLADFGIVKLAGGDSRLTGTSVVGTPAYMSPEQAQGYELTPRADLYSFGVVIWEVLTGQLPFNSDSVMNLMLKHITDPVPDITNMGPHVSPALNDVMKKALAKDVDDRYSSGVAFNDAFQRAINEPVGASIARDQTLIVDQFPQDRQPTPSRSTPSKPIQIQLPGHTAPITLPIDPDDPNRPGTIVIQPQSPGSNTAVFLAFGVVALIAIAALVLVLINSSAPPAPEPTAAATQQASVTAAPTQFVQVVREPTFGRASFSSSADELTGDSINLRAEGFATAPPGKMYVASLVNTESGDRLRLGRVTVDAVGAGALSYTDEEGRFLPTLYNAVEVTLEDNGSDSTFADVRYRSELPVETMAMMREIFVESENGINGRGLLQTAMADGTFARQHAGLAAGATSLSARRTHNEHTLNILLGGLQDFDGNGQGLNPGTRLGLLPMLDRMEAALTNVTGMPNAPVSVQSDAELVRVCLQNVRAWAGEVINFEQSMLLAETIEQSNADAQESTVFADQLLPGVDANQNAIVEPFEGECGLDQIEIFGLVVASFDLFEAPSAAAGDD